MHHEIDCTRIAMNPKFRGLEAGRKHSLATVAWCGRGGGVTRGRVMILSDGELEILGQDWRWLEMVRVVLKSPRHSATSGLATTGLRPQARGFAKDSVLTGAARSRSQGSFGAVYYNFPHAGQPGGVPEGVGVPF